jgi:FMN reductase
MSKNKLKVVAVSGGLQRPSRTLVLVESLVAALSESLPLDIHMIELGQLAPGLGRALYRSQLPADVESHVVAIENADALVVASPVFRASFSGLFKHLFDLVHQDALIDIPVLLAATGGSERHALVIEHQLRPLFSFFQARTLPIGVYASERDFSGYEITSAALRDRIALAAERAVPWLREGRSTAIQRDTVDA